MPSPRVKMRGPVWACVRSGVAAWKKCARSSATRRSISRSVRRGLGLSGTSDAGDAIEEALAYRREGGQALVDPTNVGIARDPRALQRIARATGLHVVMGAGYYTEPSHPPDMGTRSEDAITAEIVRDLTLGV